MRKVGIAVLFGLAAWITIGAHVALADEAAAIYDPGTVVFIDLTLTPTEKAKLEATPSEYVKGTFSLTESSDGTPSGEEASPIAPPRPVEVRLKGSVGGSFRDLTGKAAFKLKFKKADAFLGLRKMTLNNMVQDPSMLHETLAYAAFRAAGVPASRTGYAYVRLNGEDFGLYLDLENLDSVGLGRIFGVPFDTATQHLYEGENGHDVKPGEETAFEVDEGDEEHIEDLEALIEAVNGEGEEPWSTRVAPSADLAEMTRMWAVEKYIDHWDGYSGHAEAGLRPNNYYLYSDPSGRFQMLPWGADQTWIPTVGTGMPWREVTFDNEGGVLFNKCLEDDACFRSYWESLSALTETIATLSPGKLAEETAGLLEPWEAEERAQAPTRFEFDQGEVEDGVEESLDFIAGRTAEAEAWLAANEPPPIVHDEPAAPTGTETQPPPRSTGPAALFAGSRRSGRYLATGLQLSGAGKVTIRVSRRTPHGRKKVCASSNGATVAGELTIGCKLSRVTMSELAQRALRLRLAITIVLVDGRTESIVRTIRLARD